MYEKTVGLLNNFIIKYKVDVIALVIIHSKESISNVHEYTHV